MYAGIWDYLLEFLIFWFYIDVSGMGQGTVSSFFFQIPPGTPDKL